MATSPARTATATSRPAVPAAWPPRPTPSSSATAPTSSAASPTGGADSEGVCLESENAIGDLQVLGQPSADQVSFTSAAVSVPERRLHRLDLPRQLRADRRPVALARHHRSLHPAAAGGGERRRRPGARHQPGLRRRRRHRLPGVGRRGRDPRAGPERDRGRRPTGRSASTADERRVTYTQAASGAAVPRTHPRRSTTATPTRVADEHDLWLGLGIAVRRWRARLRDRSRATRPGRHPRRRWRSARVTVVTDPDTGDIRDLRPTSPATSSMAIRSCSAARRTSSTWRTTSRATARPATTRSIPTRLPLLLREAPPTAQGAPGPLQRRPAPRLRRRLLRGLGGRRQKLVGEFDHGTGRELFAHIPRPMLEHTREMVEPRSTTSGSTAPLVADDVFIDPAHAGTPDRRRPRVAHAWSSAAIGKAGAGCSRST